jgi:hypothetical protein
LLWELLSPIPLAAIVGNSLPTIAKSYDGLQAIFPVGQNYVELGDQTVTLEVQVLKAFAEGIAIYFRIAGYAWRGVPIAEALQARLHRFLPMLGLWICLEITDDLRLLSPAVRPGPLT